MVYIPVVSISAIISEMFKCVSVTFCAVQDRSLHAYKKSKRTNSQMKHAAFYFWTMM